MLTFEVIIVFLGLIGMVTALLLDKMRPGMILFSVTVFFRHSCKYPWLIFVV